MQLANRGQHSRGAVIVVTVVALISHVADIVARAKREHPYRVPGVSAPPIIDGNPDYPGWIAAQTDATISP